MRQALLYELTGLMGDALRATGVQGDSRDIRAFTDHFIALYKAQPEPPVAVLAQELVAALEDNEANHGGLLRHDTIQLKDQLRLALVAKPPGP